MQGYFGDQISARLSSTPEGFLVAQGARLCRSGWQKYHANELRLPDGEFESVQVYRPVEEVTAPSFLASLNGKCVLDNHPERDWVTSSNARFYCAGHVQNVRVAPEPLDNGDCVIVGDLVVTDESLINKIATGKRELSVGYTYELKPNGNGTYEMRDLIANHVSVVNSGRAGREIRILDHDVQAAGRACSCPRELARIAPADDVREVNFLAATRRFLGRNPTTVQDHKTFKEKPMTKAKLKQLRDLLDELAEERDQFARDAGVEVDEEQFARLASRYLGRELPLLGASRDEDDSPKRTKRTARDSQDIAAEFERNCRELRLKLQRG